MPRGDCEAPVKARSQLVEKAAVRGEWLVYRIAGLPIAVAALLQPPDAGPIGQIRRAYASYYWHLQDVADGIELLVAIAIWPLCLLVGAVWFTMRNGPAVAGRCRKSVPRQFVEQLRAYFVAGVLPPWYYIFQLHDGDGVSRARRFLQRCETKRGVFRPLTDRGPKASPLQDKPAFARHCRRHGLAAPATCAVLGRTAAVRSCDLPPGDLFVKPATGRGGKGAERWDHCGGGHYRGPSGDVLDGEALIARLRSRTSAERWLIQPRLKVHGSIADLSNGALCTVRAVTCLDERDRPELVAAVLRMAIGANRTVDNIHAGGIAAGIDLDSGELGPASDLGTNARLGWLDQHPDTGGRIRGRRLELWPEVRELSVRAHRAFADRLFVGWDIGLTDSGAVLVEGNIAPDVDLMQRPTLQGLADGRFGQLLAWHLARRQKRSAVGSPPLRPRSASLADRN
jgi:hypothetical protein